MPMLISINGHQVSESDATISLLSEAFLFGYAVFETMRTYNSVLFRPADHLDRLMNSCKHTGFESPVDPEKIISKIKKLLSQATWSESKIRVILTKDQLIIMIESLEEKPSWMYEEGIKAVRFDGERTLPLAKNLADVFCYAAKQHATKNQVYESVLVGPHGYVRECGYANLFWVKDGQLFTPDEGVLEGITRQTVIEFSPDCRLTNIKYEDLLHVDEAFITQTTSGILPLVEISGHKIGDGQPGVVTCELMTRFDDIRKTHK